MTIVSPVCGLRPWRAGRAPALDFLAASARSLAWGLAVARAGCVATGCCASLGPLPWLGPAAEALAVLGVAFAVARADGSAHAVGRFGVGFGLVRAAAERWRVPPPWPPPVPPEALALAWVALGLLGLSAASRGRARWR